MALNKDSTSYAVITVAWPPILKIDVCYAFWKLHHDSWNWINILVYFVIFYFWCLVWTRKGKSHRPSVDCCASWVIPLRNCQWVGRRHLYSCNLTNLYNLLVSTSTAEFSKHFAGCLSRSSDCKYIVAKALVYVFIIKPKLQRVMGNLGNVLDE